MMVMFGLGIGTSFGVYAMLPLYLISERGLDRTWANTLIALSRVAGLLIAFGAGWFVDRWGVRKSLAVFFGATGVLTILLGTLAGPWLTAVVFLQPLVAVCFFPAGFTAIGRIGPPKLRNVAVGFTVPLGFLFGGGLIPTGIGWAGERGFFFRRDRRGGTGHPALPAPDPVVEVDRHCRSKALSRGSDAGITGIQRH